MFSWKENGRKQMRLEGYDYSQPGMYFINPVTEDRVEWFGAVRNPVSAVGVDPCVDPHTDPGRAVMVLNAYGKIVETFWKKLPEKFPGIKLDEFVTMPNHFHGIIEIVSRVKGVKRGSTHGSTPTSGAKVEFKGIPDFIQWFKTMTTNAFYKEYANGHRFGKSGRIGKLWQRDYYEHIVRGKGDLERIRKYIRDNPTKWERDRNNTNPHPVIS